MGLMPNVQKKHKFKFKQCSCCGETLGPDSFCVTKSPFYTDGAVPFCNSCLKEYLRDKEFSWRAVDKICQMIDIPFVPKEFERLKELNGEDVFPKYAELFLDSEYDNIGWDDYYDAFKKLKAEGLLEEEIPLISEERRRHQRERWGANYSDEQLDYLDRLYDGLMNTQNVNGALQLDQALKLCKISLEIDQRISESTDFDKLLGSYDKLVKIAEFTPKNTKNLNDFDTTGELIRWMEKKGFKNSFYDNATRDIVDETIQNIQNFNQRLYINESSIGEQINNRIEQLKSAHRLESFYDTTQNFENDEYDNAGYEGLFNDDEEFIADADAEEDNE